MRPEPSLRETTAVLPLHNRLRVIPGSGPCLTGCAGRGGAQTHIVHPGGIGPTRVNAIVPVAPALLPPVKVNVSVAAEQLWNASVALPTATLCGSGTVGASNNPPVVS